MQQNDARDFGYYFFKDIIDWIVDNILPEDVFGIETLEEWARDAGWTEPEEEEENAS